MRRLCKVIVFLSAGIQRKAGIVIESTVEGIQRATRQRLGHARGPMIKLPEHTEQGYRKDKAGLQGLRPRTDCDPRRLYAEKSRRVTKGTTM